ncbi:MAG: lipid A export permease/ATP-binding protein MsbA [Nitrospinota bacterium]|nr:lipid A export permease/ATP-binding protein MsbA [Nitrospinota bacterium]
MQSTWTEYKRLLRYLKPYMGSFLFAAFCMLVVSSTSGGAAFIIQPLLDDIFIKKDREMLALMPAAIIAIYIARGVGRYIASSLMQKIGQMTVRDIRNNLYEHIQTLSLSFYKRHTTGRLVSRIVNDIQLIQDSISIVVYDLFRESFTVIVLIGVLLYRDAELTLFAVITLPFAGSLIARLGKRLRTISKSSQEQMANLTSLMQESFSGYRVVQAFGMQKYEIARFKKENEGYFALMLKTIRINELASPLLECIGAFGIAAIIWYGGMQVIEGKSTVGSFFSFLTALFMIFAPVSKLSRVYNKIQQAMAAAARVFEMLDTVPEIADAPGAKPVGRIREGVELRGVYFKYSEEPVLKNINLNVKAGTILAMVGMSGAGKSTLVDLVSRFYDPTEGAVLLDGHDLRDVTLESVRSQLGIVTQEIFLFNDTIRNNIAYGRDETLMEKVIEAAKAAYAHDFIMEFPDGYDTVIGERGSRLSGGQRQRISIARALMKDPAILILDEATSALDTESEIEVQKALNNLIKNRTTFVIAHRLSTILHADRIIVLDKGEIVQEGTHESLINVDGPYKKVFELQISSHTPGDS